MQLVVALMLCTSFYLRAFAMQNAISLCFAWHQHHSLWDVFLFVAPFLLFYIIILWQNRSLGVHCWTFTSFLNCFLPKLFSFFLVCRFVADVCAKICKILQKQTKTLYLRATMSGTSVEMNMYVWKCVCVLFLT